LSASAGEFTRETPYSVVGFRFPSSIEDVAALRMTEDERALERLRNVCVSI